MGLTGWVCVAGAGLGADAGGVASLMPAGPLMMLVVVDNGVEAVLRGPVSRERL